MQTAISERLRVLVEEGQGIESSFEHDRWYRRVSGFLQAAMGADQAADFNNLVALDSWEQHALRLGHLEGLLAREELEGAALHTTEASAPDSVSFPMSTPNSRKVFVVHGLDNEAKEGTARFLGRLGLEPVILHEQASSGRTIIEKFETYSGDIAFAVVLLTPDDVGYPRNGPNEPKPRARQNVILELGYFMGRLGRDRVCALHRGDVELPSDYQGVIYVELDTGGAWRPKLAQELAQAKLPIDLSGLLGG